MQLPVFLEKNRLNVQLLWIIWGLALFIGLLCSKFLITLALIFPAAWALIERLRKTPLNKNFYKEPVYLGLVGIYLLMLFGSIWNAEDTTELFTRLRVNLAFLTLPIAWALLPKMEMRTVHILAKAFIYCIGCGLLWTLVNYLLNYEAINDDLLRSKSIPVPHKDHIRFSLMVCLAIYMAIWIGKTCKARWYYFLALLFTIALHILAVRSGILAFYLCLLASILVYFIKNKKFVKGGIALILFVCLPYFAFKYIESFRTKIQLTFVNLHLMKAGDIGEYSDTQRFLSYQVGWEIYKTAPVFGIGIGNIQKEVNKIYERDYPQQKPLMPHNQYLSYMIGLGLVGLIIFLALSAWIFFGAAAYKSYLMMIFYIIFFSSFLTENTLFISIGSNMYVYFILLFANVARIERERSLEKGNGIL